MEEGLGVDADRRERSDAFCKECIVGLEVLGYIEALDSAAVDAAHLQICEHTPRDCSFLLGARFLSCSQALPQRMHFVDAFAYLHLSSWLGFPHVAAEVTVGHGLRSLGYTNHLARARLFAAA